MRALDLKTIFHKELNEIYGKDEVASLFYLCLEHFLDMPRIQLNLNPELSISKPEYDSFFSTLSDLKHHKPIQYIFGETEFYGLKFKVNQNVLIPRQETEELVSLIIKDSKLKTQRPMTILDIGTGSGCIAISLARHLPNAQVYALDVSKDVLEVAKANAKLNDVDIHFINDNILDVVNKNFLVLNKANPQIDTTFFDIIVSNPPYVRQKEKAEMNPNVLDNEPHLALFVDDNNPLVFYKAITNFAVNNLKVNGKLYFEINQYLGEDTKQLLVDVGFSDIELKKDLNNNDRILKSTKV